MIGIIVCVFVVLAITDGLPQTDTAGSDRLEPQGRQLNEDYVFYESAHGSFKLHRTPATWKDARLRCYDEGAELASPENQNFWIAMSKILQTSVQPPLRVYTGINDLYAKGFFNSIGGTPLSEMPARRASSESINIQGNENCLLMQRNGQLLDTKCDSMNPYICFKRVPPNQDTICGTNGYEYDNTTKSCYKFHSIITTWDDAFAKCVREGGYLAIINSVIEAQVVAKLRPREQYVWAFIGYTFWRKDLWVTIHGQTLAEAGYEKWANGEPNNYENEHCGAIAHDGNLNDLDCLRLMNYICEKKPSVILY